MPNRYIKQQCENMILTIKIFEQGCEMAAKRDDEHISKEEAKILKKIYDAGHKYRVALKQIAGAGISLQSRV